MKKGICIIEIRDFGYNSFEGSYIHDKAFSSVEKALYEIIRMEFIKINNYTWVKNDIYLKVATIKLLDFE